jgi:broad specificity phosphatase PhoE
MPPQKLMLIRHAEKEPDDGPPPYGINANGEKDKHSLSVRGWQRAGALVPFFQRAWANGIERPGAIYASKVGDQILISGGQDISKSLRPQQTVTPLADALEPSAGLQTPFAVGEEAVLSRAIKSNESGVVLVAWEHNHIPKIAKEFSSDAPDSWSDSCFDNVWILTRRDDGNYQFSQSLQSLLGGDLTG